MVLKPSGGQALFTLVRFWSRRWLSPWKDIPPQPVAYVQSIVVLEVIVSLSGNQPVSITDVARNLAIDHSVASRMVAKAADDGLVVKQRSQGDPRQMLLSLTSKGESILADAHAWQEQIFRELTQGWSESDAEQLAEYLTRLANDLKIEE